MMGVGCGNSSVLHLHHHSQLIIFGNSNFEHLQWMQVGADIIKIG